jgi:hypothetical protein
MQASAIEDHGGGLDVKYGVEGERKLPVLGQTGRRGMYGLCAQEALVVGECFDPPQTPTLTSRSLYGHFKPF